MDNVTFLEITKPDETIVEIAQIDNGDNAFTSMTKAEYDRRQAEQSTPNLPA
jgi:hypothetical protein